MLYILSGAGAINISVSNVSILSKGKNVCHGYQNVAFEKYTCSVPKRGFLFTKLNYFQAMLG
jgi:hypothetical protein